MSLLQRATQLTTVNIITPADGIEWRVVKMPPLVERRFASARLSLLSARADGLIGMDTPEHEPDPSTEEGRAAIREMAERVQMFVSSSQVTEMEQRVGDILAECVTHAREPDGAWRPVHLVPEGEGSEGDGTTTPDVIPYPRLAPETQAALVDAAQALTSGGEQRERLLQAFRSRRGVGVVGEQAG